MSFRRLKKNYRGRRKGDVFKTEKKELTLKEFLAVHKNPSFRKRPLYIMDGHEVRRAVLEDGQVMKNGLAGKAGSEKRGYNTPQQTCPDLTPSKAVQRKDLAENIKGGTVLETHAGKGNLSKEVYSKKVKGQERTKSKC